MAGVEKTSGVFFTWSVRKRLRRLFPALALALAPALLLSQTPALQSGLDLSSFDRSVRPQDDLYRFANGGWIARTPMPDDRVTYTAATELAEKVEGDLHSIIQTVLALPERRPGSAVQQIADLYTSMVDEAHDRVARRRATRAGAVAHRRGHDDSGPRA